MTDAVPTQRTEIKRLPQRARYDRKTIYDILDQGMICHVGFTLDGQVYVIPTIYVRIGDCVYLHGSPASRTLQALERGTEACLAVTLVDGLVLARSAFHHSMNYRSVVLFGKATPVVDDAGKLDVLRGLSEHLIRGRFGDVRPPSPQELKRTTVLAIAIDEASAKVRTGPPLDDEPDYDLPVWAGVLPLEVRALPPLADARLAAGMAPPDYAVRYAGPRAAPERT